VVLGVRAATVLIAAACGSWGCDTAGCHSSRFEVIATATADKIIACCDTTAVRDVPMAQDDGELLMAVQRDPSVLTQVDGWLTRADCVQLFDPGSNSPKCEVLIGPIAAGSVSSRRPVPRGNYRIFVRPQNDILATVPVLVDVQIWGTRCSVSPVGL
jgi:hypothetical protein